MLQPQATQPLGNPLLVGPLAIGPSGKPIGINQRLANGQNDFYTVPTGKVAVFMGSILNITGGSLNWTPMLKVAGTYYTTAILAAVANNATAQIGAQILNGQAGDTFSILASGANLNLFGQVLLFDAVDVLKVPRLTVLAVGDNIVYTCPAGKVAIIQTLLYTNLSGANRTIRWNIVPSGSAAGAANQIVISTVQATNTKFQSSLQLIAINAGDSVTINTDAVTATQFAWIGVVTEIST